MSARREPSKDDVRDEDLLTFRCSEFRGEDRSASETRFPYRDRQMADLGLALGR